MTSYSGLREDPLLRFWTSPRSADTNHRERQLTLDVIAASAGGPTFYLGRDMKTSHRGMGINKKRLRRLRETSGGHAGKFNVPPRERNDVMSFISSLESDIVEG